MFVNQVTEYFKKASKLIKFSTNQKNISIVYLFFFILLLVGLVFLIVGTSLAASQLSLILSFVGIVTLILGLIVFYIFEYLRRKANIKISSLWNFKYLYDDNLYDAKIIQDHILLDKEFDKSFYKQHCEMMNRLFKHGSLTSNYATYWMNMNSTIYFFSYCNVIANENITKQNKGIFKKHKYMQLIICKNINTPFEGFICKKGKYDNNMIQEWQKFEHDDFDIYSMTEKTTEISSIITKIKELEKINLTCDVKLKGGKLFFLITVPNNFLLLNFRDIKFNEVAISKLIESYDKDWTTLVTLLNIIKVE